MAAVRTLYYLQSQRTVSPLNQIMSAVWKLALFSFIFQFLFLDQFVSLGLVSVGRLQDQFSLHCLHSLLWCALDASASAVHRLVSLCSPYVIGTMRSSSSSTSVTQLSLATDLQLTHHNFRWVLLTNRSEPVRLLLSRYLQRQLVTEELAGRPAVVSEEDGSPGDMGRVIAWLPVVWNRVNHFIEANCTPDVTLGIYLCSTV